MSIEELASVSANKYIGHGPESKEDMAKFLTYKDGYERGAYYVKENLINKVCSMLIMFNCDQAKRFGPKAVLSCTDFTIDVHNFRQQLEAYGL